MDVKRLFAPSMREALQEVRQTLGDDAMIVATRQVPGGVEVTAAIERAAPAPRASATRRSTPTADHRLAPEPEPEPGRMAPEGWRWLKHLGLTPDAVLRTVRRGPTDPREALVNALPVVPRPVAPRSGRYVFVGSAGAGKTAMVSRLLANRVLTHGRDGVVVVTADCWRPGGGAELERLGRLLDVPVVAAPSAADLEQVVAAQPGDALVLVDTAGLPVGSAAFEEQRAGLAALSSWMNTVLVLPVTLQLAVLRQHAELARSLGATGLALSRLDEAVSLGEAFSVALAMDLPINWVATGPAVPDDLESPDARDLVARAEAYVGELPLARQAPGAPA